MRASSVETNGSAHGAEGHNPTSLPSASRQSSTRAIVNPDAPRLDKSKDLVVVVDARLLPRECLARFLSLELEVPVECFSSIREWMGSGLAASASAVVVCQHGATHADAINEVDMITDQAAPRRRCPLVIISDSEDPDLIVQMLDKNVRGYVPTSLSLDVAAQAVKLVRAGGVFVPASSLIAAHRSPDEPPASKGLFTARQAAVVDALRRGKANKIIAYELNMRESTVKVHVRNIMKKLHATNRTEVAYLANCLFNGEEPAR